MEVDFDIYYNKGNDCDCCKNQYFHGIDGDKLGCKCKVEGKECEYVEDTININ